MTSRHPSPREDSVRSGLLTQSSHGSNTVSPRRLHRSTFNLSDRQSDKSGNFKKDKKPLAVRLKNIGNREGNGRLEYPEPCKSKNSELFKDNGLDFTVKIIANERFQREIIAMVHVVAKKVNDMSELFLRSYQLLETCGKILK
jgi:hypothetical protein